MNKSWVVVALALCPWWSQPGGTGPAAAAPVGPRHRSPADLAILPDGLRVLTANPTANTISLIHLESGKVLAEHPVGEKPLGVACSPDGRRVAVSNHDAGTLSLLELEGDTLQVVATVPIGAGPRGVVFAADSASVYAALARADEVIQCDWHARHVVRRWPAGVEPRRVVLSRDGRFLAAAGARSAQVLCWETQTGKLLWERTILDAFNLHGLTFSPDGKELVAAHCHDRHHTISKPNIEQGWAIDNRLSRVTVEPDPAANYWQLALDVRGQAVADPCAAAFSSRGDWLAVAAAGTGELILFQNAAIPWSNGDPGDFLNLLLDRDDGKYRRIPLGGRPVALQFTHVGDRVVVANALLDALQVVDAKTGKLVQTIHLGGSARPGLARQGEAIFYDAKRSHHQWFSCHTCHPDGHTSGRVFDTLNDDSYGNPKLAPTLRGVAHTAPYTWHGWQQDLGDAVVKSFTETQFGPKPTAAEVNAVVAFLRTLDHPPNPDRAPTGKTAEAAARGKTLFQGKAKCASCHQGDRFLSAKNYDVKLESDGSPFELWNPPSLRGLRDRGPYLHDGRAETLEELLRYHHAPERLGNKSLTPEERADLIAFLKTL